MTDDEILLALAKREGPYVDDPDDPGGPTNWGITAQQLGAWLGLKRAATREEVRNMPQGTAIEIYRELYMRRPGFQAIRNSALRALVVDCAVQHGQDDAAKWLQAAIGGLKADGFIGPKSRKAIEALPDPPTRVYVQICAIRAAYYGELVQQQPYRVKYIEGWLRARVSEFLEATPLKA